MQNILSVKQIKEQENALIRSGIDEIEMTKRVALFAFEKIKNANNVAIFCGSGNNGGDGVALACLLAENGVTVTLVFASVKMSNTSKHFYEICERLAVKSEVWKDDFDFSCTDLIVDCLLGIGFSGELKPEMAKIITAINNSGKKVIAIDIPSGLNGDNGLGKLAVSCKETIVAGALKGGVLLNDAKDFCGQLSVADIGFSVDSDTYLIEAEDFAELNLKRKNNCHKGSFGTAGIFAGCLDYSGASKLASISLSALKNGCGISRLIVPDCIASYVAPFLLESTLKTVNSVNGSVSFNEQQIDDVTANLTSLAFGMGMGNSQDVFDTLKYILQTKKINLVIDADGINALAKDKSILLNTKCKVLITPHIKEFSRLTGATVNEILNNPIQFAKAFAKDYKIVVLLKGTATVVTDGDVAYIINRGSSGMATAGSGDVLSGILAGLMAFLPLQAKTVSLGAYINGLAGELAEKQTNCISMVASDTVNQIANAIKFIINKF